MIRCMLDTSTCIHIVKHHPESIRMKLSSLRVGEVGVSSIVSAELWYGVACSTKRKENEAALNDFLEYIEVLHWPKEAARLYGKIRAELRSRGAQIGAMDLLIGAHAMFLETILVTDNVKEFERIPGLNIENWLGGRS